MTNTKRLNEKTQAVVSTRMESPANRKQQVDTLYMTNESRMVEIDAEPDRTYLIVDESDSYARRLRMFEEEEYTPPTVNINVGAGYGYGYDWPYYSSWYTPGWSFGAYYSPWYRSSPWIGYNYWDSWYYYPGYYRPWYYGGHYSYYYPHHHHYYNDYNSNVHYGRRTANASSVRHASPVGNSRSNVNAASATQYSTRRPQIQQVRGSSVPQSSGNTGNTGYSVESRRRSVSSAGNNTSTSLQQNTGSNSNTAVTSRRSSNAGTGGQSVNYTRTQTTTPAYNTSNQNAASSRRRTTQATTPSNRSSNQSPAVQYNNTSNYQNSAPASSSQINSSRRSSSGSSGSSGNSGSSGSTGSSGGSSRRR
jgi:hypothetical protein